MTKKHLLHFTATLAFALLIVNVFAQCPPGATQTMADGTFIVSDGCVITDDGGGGPYNETGHTMTLCPDTPGDVVQLTFSAVGLQTSPNPANNDVLYIFDGNSTAGMELGSAFQNLQVTGTVNNTSGCLTLVFDVNGTANTTFPGFEATVSTTTPCANPTAMSEIISPAPVDPAIQTVNVCVGSPVTFGDAGSTGGVYPPGQNYSMAEWIWNFDDGTIVTNTGPSNVEHSFDEPGEYIVTLTVEDNNLGDDNTGCTSLNVLPLQILVSTSPTFTGMLDAVTCLGDTIIGLVEVGEENILDDPTNIGGGADGTTWTALPPQVVSGQTYLADGAGFSYSSTLNFDFFDADATLQNCDDFISVFVNLEHSYSGDVSISVSCPNGTTVDLVAFPSGGGGTYLGEPIDDGIGGTLDMGVGYTYSWEPNTTNPTWTEAFNAGGYTVPNVGNPSDDSFEPGMYAATGDLCDFIGCPLNGQWSFSILDNLGADNGYIFEWGISLNPALYPDVTTFTPTIGAGADSSYWVTTGPGTGIPWIVNVSDDADYIEIVPLAVGTYEYKYNVINSFGCTFDTSMFVTVELAPQVTAGQDLNYNCGAVVLEGGLVNEQPVSCSDCGSFSYCYDAFDWTNMTYCPDNAAEGVISISVTSGSMSANDFLEVYDGNSTWASPMIGTFTDDLAGMTWTSTDVSGCLTILFNEWDGVNNCNDGGAQAVQYEVTAVSAAAATFVWEWTPTLSLNDPTIPMPTVYNLNQTTTYTLQGHPVGFPGCSSSDQATITIDPLGDPGQDSTITICANVQPFDMFDFLGGTPVNTGVWSDELGNDLPNGIFDPATALLGDYQYTVTSGGCDLFAVLTIDSPPALDSEIEGPASMTICYGAAVNLDTVFVDGPSPYSFQWTYGNTPIGTSNDFEFVPDSSGTIQLSITDNCNINWTDSIDVIVLPALDIVVTADTTAGCWPQPYTLNCTAASGNQSLWTFSDGSVYNNTETVTHTFEQPGTYGINVTITNALGCQYTMSYPSLLNSYAPPVAGYVASPQPTDIMNPEIQFTDMTEGYPIVSYAWTFYNSSGELLGGSAAANPTYEFSSDYGGDYTIQLEVTDIHNCTDVITPSTVTVDDILQFYIPTAFTPNGDGVNDELFFKGADIDPTRFEFKIFNRFGEIVFETADPSMPWVGNIRDGQYFAPNGPYNWIATIVSVSTGVKKELSGSVIIAR